MVLVQFSRGTKELPLLRPLGQYEDSQMLMWLRGAAEQELQCDQEYTLGVKDRPRDGYRSLQPLDSDILLLDSHSSDLQRPVDCKALAHTIREV